MARFRLGIGPRLGLIFAARVGQARHLGCNLPSMTESRLHGPQHSGEQKLLGSDLAFAKLDLVSWTTERCLGGLTSSGSCEFPLRTASNKNAATQHFTKKPSARQDRNIQQVLKFSEQYRCYIGLGYITEKRSTLESRGSSPKSDGVQDGQGAK